MEEKKKLKTSPAQARARNKWDRNNKERKKIASYKSAAKNFILKYSKEEDLQEFEKWIEERRINL